MGEAIITRRGGSGSGGAGEVIVEFENFTPSDTVGTYHPDGELVRSTPTALSEARYSLAGASVGNYALFAGGSDGSSSYRNTVDAYDIDLIRSTPSALSVARSHLAGASVGNYVLFAGGYDYDHWDTVDAYNTDLVRSTPTALSVAREDLAGASIGDYALFAGGITGNRWNTVDAYNTELVRSTPTALSVARDGLAGASVGNYALFAGGLGNDISVLFTVDAYDTSLTHSTPIALSVARMGLAGASVGNYALFAGGYDLAGGVIGSRRSTVDAYDASLVHSTPTELSVARNQLAGASVGNYALFAGGYGGNSYRATVDAYNASLIRSVPIALSEARARLAGASVGDYVLFAGGYTGSSWSTVDAYTPQVSLTMLYVPIGTRYRFGESEEIATTNEITVPVPLTGYIKYESGVVGTEGSVPDDN